MVDSLNARNPVDPSLQLSEEPQPTDGTAGRTPAAPPRRPTVRDWTEEIFVCRKPRYRRYRARRD